MVKGLVSVIVPCYLKAKYLPETLDSIIAQTYTCWECIIVNDGSPDDTDAIAQRYCNSDNRFHYLSQTNSGLSISRNNGIQISNGEYILPLDADDTIDNSYLEKAVDFFSKHPDTKLVYCKAQKFGAENGAWELSNYNYETLKWNNCIFCSALYRRVDYDKTLGYNPNMSHGLEDWDFWLSLLREDDYVYQIPETLFHYRTTCNSMIKRLSNNTEEMHRQLVKNHPEIYTKYFLEIIDLKLNIISLQEELSQIQTKLEHAQNSAAFRIGTCITKPLKKILKRC